MTSKRAGKVALVTGGIGLGIAKRFTAPLTPRAISRS